MDVVVDLLLVLVLLLLLLAAMAGVWLIFSAIGARVSGWRRLAAHYRHAGQDLTGVERSLPRLRMGGVIFKRGITAIATVGGLYLRPWIGERLSCKPLLLPWSMARRAQAVPLAQYLQPGPGAAGAAAALLVRLSEKAIHRGLARHPELHNVLLEIDDGNGGTVELELIIDIEDVAPFLPQLGPARSPR